VLAFLNNLAINGAVPTPGPIHTFEYAWVLWNIGLIDNLDDETLALCQPVFKALRNVWDPKDGLGVVEGLSYKSADTTAITCQALTRFGCSVDLSGLLHYEDDEHFRSYPMDANVSIGANVHALGALRQAGFEVKHPSVQKVLRFLKQARTGRSFWFDKWHASPYYATGHAIIAAAGYADDLVTSAVEWIVNTQNEDGSWGFYAPSAEETAYCLQALAVWKRQDKGDEEISTDILKRGADWLTEHMDEPYPWLWIGKSLYCPELVVESAILSALMLVEQS
jgi:halimadienyl-diphosphate synthase